jgi:hypothetical protein
MSMSTRRKLELGALSLGAALGAGLFSCGNECGPGTYPEGGSCKAGLPIFCGPGTVLVAGRCEPTTGSGGAQCGAGTVAAGDTCVPEFPPGANGARFTSMRLIDPVNVAPAVTAILGPAVAAGQVLVLWKMRGVTTTDPPRRRMAVGPGQVLSLANGEAIYVLTPGPSETTATIAEDGSFAADPCLFRFEVIPGSGEAGVLLVEQTVMTCWLTSAEILDPAQTCSVVGAVTRENGDKVRIAALDNKSLSELLDSAGQPMDTDCNGDGVANDCWKLTVSFTTEAVIVQDEWGMDGGTP